MSFELPKLPYAKDSLVPYMSAETLGFHYGKHHAAYVNSLNELVEGSTHEGMSLEEIIQVAEGPLFNMAAQHWNHSFFWTCLAPGGGGSPTGELAAAIDRDFGGLISFREEFVSAAVGQFGSGWAWLVLEGGQLKITTTSNADLPMRHGQKALFTVDVWEHAYYMDHRSARPKFVETVLDQLANWRFAAQNLSQG